jgi:DNA-binding response OmpR family regulator
MLAPPAEEGAVRGRVLVVDDDPKFARLAVRALELAGYECLVGDSGDQALWAVLRRHIDAIVLDVMMPHPSGMEVCRHLRANGWTGGVVIVSARSNPNDQATAARAGADAFLSKPFPLDELVSAIGALVRNP